MGLLEALSKIKEEKRVSFHMPGHKNGKLIEAYMGQFLELDITEIPDADNLHDAMGCILETEQGLASYYGVRQSKMLVGGSTCGILAMILGTTKRGDGILINRNAHQSVYHAIALNDLVPHYLMPEVDEELGIARGIKLSDVQEVPFEALNIKTCLLTYPTYEGICYPIEDIIKHLKSIHVTVIIDEAHGAHLNMHPMGPKSTVAMGADYVVQSLHKTLPAMTQAAVVHFCGEQTYDEDVAWHLKVLQTSSPSYVIMASMDAMLQVMVNEGKALARALEENVAYFYKKTSQLKHLDCKPRLNQDVSKIFLLIPNHLYHREKWNGFMLGEKLLQLGIQVEYCNDRGCLLMTSIANTSDDFQKCYEALRMIDMDFPNTKEHHIVTYPYILPQRVFIPSEIKSHPSERIKSSEALGRVAMEYITPYPPGIPLIVPGEIVSEDILRWILDNKEEITVMR